MFTTARPHQPRRAIVLGRTAVGLAAVGALSSLGGLPSSAALSPHTAWTTVPSACSPDEASTGRYDSHVSAFKHTPAATGQVVTRCNVVQLPDFTGGLDQRLEVTYRDPDGLGTRSQVQADLIQARPDGSTLILAHFDSNRFTNTATATHTFGYHHAFDFSRNAYYVDVRVTRSTTSLAPSVSTVRLSERS